MEEQMNDFQMDCRMMIDNMMHGYALHQIIVDEAGEPIDYIYIDLNEQFEEFTGLNAKNTIGKKVTQVIPNIRESDFDWIKFYGDIALNNKKEKFEQHFDYFDRRYQIFAFSPKKNYFITMVDEITESKHTETKLKQAQDIVDNIQIGLYIYHLEVLTDDRTLRMVSANPITEKFTGVKTKDVIGKTLDENFPGLREKGIPQKYAEVVRTQMPVELKDVYYGDNRVVQGAFSVKAFPLPDNHVGVSFENITKRVQAEEQVKKEQNFIERMINVSPDIIYIYDLINHQNIFANKNIFDILGYTAEEIQEMGNQIFSKTVHPQDLNKVIDHHCEIRNTKGERGIYELEYRMKSKEGDWFWLYSRDVVFNVDEQGFPNQILGTAINITETKKIEKELEEHRNHLEKLVSKRTEELNKAYDELRIQEKHMRDNLARHESLIFSLGEVVYEHYVPENKILWKGAVKETLGYSLKQMGDDEESWTSRVHPDDLESVNQEFARAMKENHVFDFQYRFQHKKGYYLWVHDTGKMLFSEDGMLLSVTGVLKNINDKKKAEQKLAEREAQLKTLFEQASDPIYLIDKEGNFLDVNPQACKELGYTKDEYLNMTVQDVDHEFKTRENEKWFWENLPEDESVTFEVTLHKKNGETIPVEIKLSKYEKEGIVFLYAIGRNLSERKKTESALRRSEERLRHLMQNVKTGIVVHDKTTRIVQSNKTAQEILGLTEEQMLGVNAIDPRWRFVREDETVMSVEEFPVNKVLSEKTVLNNYVFGIYIPARNAITWVLVNAVPEFDSSGGVEQVLVTFFDITDRKNAESRQQLTTHVLDLLNKGSESGDVIKEILGSIRKFTGIEAVGIRLELGEDYPYYVSEGFPDSFIMAENSLCARFENGRPMRDKNGHVILDCMCGNVIRGNIKPELPFFTKGGSFWTNNTTNLLESTSEEDRQARTRNRCNSDGYESVALIPLRTGAETIGLLQMNDQRKNIFTEEMIEFFEGLGASIGISLARRRAENNLKIAKENAERANKAKSVFLANMSHEIRTPMNAILGFTDLVYNHNTDPVQKNYLESVKSSSKTLLHLINDILDLSKIEAEKMSIHPEPTNIDHILTEVKHILSLKATQKNLSFITETNQDGVYLVDIDVLRLRQILINLAGNGIKFSESGYVKLSAQTKLINNKPGYCSLEIIVEDTGIGIPKEAHESIFESFTQQDMQSIKKYGGTGLGLSITKRLVELMNGEINIESEPGRGSKFHICFKENKVSHLQGTIKEEIDYHNIEFGEGTVLIADDVKTNLNLISGYLKETKLKLLVAENGLDALQLAERYTPDIIFMDIRMPEMDGYESARIIKNKKRLKAIPIIATTASIMQSEYEEQKAFTFDGYLQKPITINALYDELAKYLPYRLSTETRPSIHGEDSFEIDHEVRNRIPELVRELQQDCTDKKERALNANNIEDINEFALVLKEKGEKYNLDFLIAYGNEIVMHANNFDLENVKVLIDSYDQMLNTLIQYETNQEETISSSAND